MNSCSPFFFVLVFRNDVNHVNHENHENDANDGNHCERNRDK